MRFGSKRTGNLDPQQLYQQLRSLSGALSDGYLITTEQVLEEELRVIRYAQSHGAGFAPLGDTSQVDLSVLDGDQREAVEQLARCRAGIAVMIGDAGTGKTHALARLDQAHRQISGTGLIALAPTTRATAELRKNGYGDAATVAAFLASDHLQAAATGRAVLVDEAGFLSSCQLAELVRVAEERRSRVWCWSATASSTNRSSAAARCAA